MSDSPTPEHQGRVIRKELALDATPEEAWKAWADPELIARWFVDRAEGKAEPGSFMTWHFEKFGMSLPVPILAAEPGKRLLIGGQRPGSLPFLQEITVEQEGGRTILRLANSGFAEGAEWDDEYEGVASGWELALAHLKFWLENHRDLDRTHLLTRGPTGAGYEELQPYYTTADGLNAWLCTSAELGHEPLRAGDSVALELRDLGRLSGVVLARSTRELLLSWDEHQANLSLKCFGIGPLGRAVSLDYSVWPSCDAAEEARVQAALDAATERLVALLPEVELPEEFASP